MNCTILSSHQSLEFRSFGTWHGLLCIICEEVHMPLNIFSNEHFTLLHYKSNSYQQFIVSTCMLRDSVCLFGLIGTNWWLLSDEWMYIFFVWVDRHQHWSPLTDDCFAILFLCLVDINNQIMNVSRPCLCRLIRNNNLWSVADCEHILCCRSQQQIVTGWW